MLQDNFSSVSLAGLIAADNWQAKYRLLTEWGKLIQPKPSIRANENLVRGCETSVWIVHHTSNNLHYFEFDCDSRIIGGLLALLSSQINQQSAEHCRSLALLDLLQQAGLQKHLTPSRNNGFIKIIERVSDLVCTRSDLISVSCSEKI